MGFLSVLAPRYPENVNGAATIKNDLFCKRNTAYKERITSFKKFLLQTPEKGLNFVCFSTLGGSRNGITPEQDRTG